MPPELTDHATAPTLAAGDTLVDPASTGSAAPPARSSTATVLPRVAVDSGALELVFDSRLRYEPERILGEGGMGEVRLARDNDIGRPVALKQIRGDIGEHGVARFVEEVRTVGVLEHPNIVPIHDVGIDADGRYYLVMKYVEGETVERVIERLAEGDPDAHARYGFEARVNIFLGLLRALAHAHERGFIHRDVKPANVMVGPLGEVVLMDWGVARPIDAEELPGATADAPHPDRRRVVHTRAGALVGTPHYMSPEQARGQPDIDARSDLYSACVLFHELLTLRHYLADRPQNVPSILVGVLEEELPTPPEIIAANTPVQPPPPATYLHFVRRGLKKARDERWSSAEEMIEELEAALAGHMRVQCAVTFTRRAAAEAGRFVDRHPQLALASFVALALLVVTGIVGLAVTALS